MTFLHSASFNGAFEALGCVLEMMKAGRQKHLHKWCFMWHKAMLVGHRLRHWCCKLRRMCKGLAHPQMYSGLKEGFLYTKTVLLSIVSRSKNNSGRETPYKPSVVWWKPKNLFKVSLHYRWLSGGPSAFLTWALLPLGLDMDVSSVGSGDLEHCRVFLKRHQLKAYCYGCSRVEADTWRWCSHQTGTCVRLPWCLKLQRDSGWCLIVYVSVMLVRTTHRRKEMAVAHTTDLWEMVLQVMSIFNGFLQGTLMERVGKDIHGLFPQTMRENHHALPAI